MAKQSNVVQLDPKRALEVFADRIETLLERRKRDRASLGKLLCDTQALFKNTKGNIDAGKWADWLEARFKLFDISRATAYRYMDAYRAVSNETKTEKRGRSKGSGRTAGAGGRGRGGGKGTTTDSVAAAATSPANPTPVPANTALTPGGAGQEGADQSISAPSAPSANPMPGWLEQARARIKELEQGQAMLLEANRDLAEQLETAQATLAAPATDKRTTDLLEKLRERDMRIDELNAQIAAGTDAATRKRLDNQAKLIEDLRASEKEQKRCADAARKPGPRGLGTMFQLMPRGDKMEFIRSIASFDDPSPGAEDADKVGWIDHIFKKIHSPQMKRELLGNLSGGELATVLTERSATRKMEPPPKLPTDYRRLAEPGALSKDNQFGKRPNGKHT